LRKNDCVDQKRRMAAAHSLSMAAGSTLWQESSRRTSACGDAEIRGWPGGSRVIQTCSWKYQNAERSTLPYERLEDINASWQQINNYMLPPFIPTVEVT
jgi:hypothetical protein